MDRERTPIKVPDTGLPHRMCVSVWFAQPGDYVLEGDRLVEILADDVVFDVVAPFSGRLVRIERDIHDPVEPGDIVGWLERVDDIDDTDEEESEEAGGTSD